MFLEDSLRESVAAAFAGNGTLDLPTLIELGWEELVAQEPVVGVSVLAEEQGRRLGTSRLVELVMGRELGLDPALDALAFPVVETDLHDPVDAVLLADAVAAPNVVVPLRGDADVVLGRFEADALERRPVGGIDVDARWTRITGAVASATLAVGAGAWRSALAVGSLALAHELTGVAGRMLDLAIEHVCSRVQFGVPIGSFQAVQHRLADVFVDLEGARAVARTAWIDRDPAVCTAALAAAHRALESATRHCHQVLGAMGCTWEHPLHRSMRRGAALQLLLEPDRDLRAIARTAVVDGRQTEVLS